MKKLFIQFYKTLITLAILICSFTISLAQDSIPTIKVGCDYAYYPYEFINENHEADGFDIDIMKALCEEMNVNLEIETGNWFKIKKKIENGELDAVAGMYYLPDRAEKVNFSMPFIIITHSIFVKEGDYWQSLKDVRDEERLKVVVENSSILHKYLTSAGIAPNRIIAVENQLDALKILSETPNSCALLPDLQGKYIANKNGYDHIKTVGLPILPREYSIAINKDDTLLLNRINDAITEINNNGTYYRIYNKWFGSYNKQTDRYINFNSLELSLISLLIILLIVFAIWTRKNRKQLTENTNKLNQEISNNISLEQNLIKNETIIRKITENTVYPMAMLNTKGYFIYVNRLFEDKFGYTKKEVYNVGQWLDIFINDPDYKQRIKTIIENIIHRLESDDKINAKSTDIIDITTKSGENLKIIIRMFSLGEDQILLFFENLTEVIQKEKKLTSAKIKAESADKLKSILLANISKEIRDSIGDILLHSSQMTIKNISEEEKLSLNKAIHKYGEFLQVLTGDIIDFNKIESGKLMLSPKITDLTNTVRDTYTIIREKYHDLTPEPIKFVLKLPKNFEHTKYFIKVDIHRIQQVLIKLLVSAFYQTKSGLIEFGFNILENNKVRVYVKDSGAKIRINTQGYILDDIKKQSEHQDIEDFGSIGLGLLIAFQTLKLFGSELQINDTEENGNIFSFDLNYYEGQGDKVAQDHSNNPIQKKPTDYNWQKKTVLLIEDDSINVTFLTTLLKKTGCTTIVCNDSKEAIETLKTPAKIDIVLLDWMLPDGSGEDITNHIKQENIKLPVIVITALSLLDEQMNHIEYNVDAYFAKPVDSNSLLIKMNDLFDA